jgi:hypothetical protein
MIDRDHGLLSLYKARADVFKPLIEETRNAKGELVSLSERAASTSPGNSAENKLERARRAVAISIVAAERAGRIQTSIDPPPILDILITGGANDRAVIAKNLEDRRNGNAKAKFASASPEVFGAWFTDFGKHKDVKPLDDLRIMNPQDGLTEFYRARSRIMTPLLSDATAVP